MQNAVDELSAVIDDANAPILGVDADLRVTVWNKKLARLTGVSSSQAVGKEVLTLLDAQHRARVRDVLSNALQGVAAQSLSVPLLKVGGGDVEILINAGPRTDESGAVVGVVGVGQVVQEIKELVEQRKKAGRQARV